MAAGSTWRKPDDDKRRMIADRCIDKRIPVKQAARNSGYSVESVQRWVKERCKERGIEFTPAHMLVEPKRRSLHVGDTVKCLHNAHPAEAKIVKINKGWVLVTYKNDDRWMYERGMLEVMIDAYERRKHEGKAV